MSSKKSKNKSNDNNKNAFVRDIDEDNRKKNYNNKGDSVNSLPTLDYIQATVQKDVQEGLLALARMKPDNPIEFLGKYLYEKSKKKKK
jgi:hypothetical protein